MISHRSTHYWLWFLVFGVVAALVQFTKNHGLDSESIWLLVTGLVGLLVGGRNLTERVARPYDLVVGFLFSGVGLLGILHNFGLNLTGSNALGGAIGNDAILGISLSLLPALIHTLLGLTSLNHGFAAPTGGSAVTVRAPAASA